MWILTAFGYIAYQLWAYLPDNILNHFGIYYIPSKYFALAVPAWIGMSFWLMVMAYVSYSMSHTHSKSSYFTMQDRHSALAHPRDIDKGPERKTTNASPLRNGDSQVAYFLNGPPRNSTQSLRSSSFMLPNYDPYRKIPDCVELPITVVNNVLYSQYRQ
jgi:PIG-P